MLAAIHDLPMRGNYFAESEYLKQDLSTGTLRNRAGAAMVALTDECVVAIHNVIAGEFGPRTAAVLQAFGRDWGRRAAEQFLAEMAKHYERPTTAIPLAVFGADLAAAFLHHGWGRVHFDFNRYSHGIVAVDVHEPFVGSIVQNTSEHVEPMLAGFLAGMFSYLSGTELDCLQTECRANGSSQSRFLLTVPERLAAVETLVSSGKPHADVLADLENTKAAP